MLDRTATCACGRVQISLRGEPEAVGACNCTQCQKRTGSAFGLGSYFKKTQVLNIQGPHKAFTRSSDAGRDIETHFCTECGSTVFWYAAFRPEHIGVAVGCFADPDFVAPTRASWTSHKLKWVTFPSSMAQIERQSG